MLGHMIYITVLSPQVHIIIVWWVSFLNSWLRQASISCVCILPPLSSFFLPFLHLPSHSLDGNVL